jgi:superfamily II DNA or RNA helicase
MSVNSLTPWQLRVHPRAWQDAALKIWREHYKGVVSVVTGGGKTLFAESCMLAFRHQYPDARFVIVVPTLTLLDQWYLSLQEDLGIPQSEIACFSSQEYAEKPGIVNLLVINSARDLASTLITDHATCLIVDECHRAGSPVNSLALRGTYTATLGLSATPVREYDDGFQLLVAPVLGQIIYEYDYSQASRDDVISPFKLINVEIELLADEAKRYSNLSKRAAIELRRIQHEKGDESRLKRILQQRAAISSAAVMRIPIAVRLVEEHRGHRTIIFHERITSANLIADNLKQRRHSVTVYHSQIPPTIRRDNLRLYRRGVFDILVACRALDEGMNVPETSVAVIASSTASHRQRIQRLGRVLRPAPGKSHATIYTIYATIHEERRLREEEEQLGTSGNVSWLRGVKRSNV